ncbi:hypothetical protein AMATHDRAFT_134280 [Amanita thiersii Skay4041]|uniref:Complex 1 LYR protein domain-containing protein n=1 Tax=Amanita thiersii Skay4041 TaxID=703135 RepID=A0A2A9P0L2_9AGAR|nr:hypothetical protein AMATHDRAFT_134280 [Amanita thiersii Skay4041]
MHPSLKHFILNQQAIRLYRRALRASRVIPDPVARKETIAWFRVEFNKTRHLTEPALIEDRFRTIRRELNQIFPLLR